MVGFINKGYPADDGNCFSLVVEEESEHAERKVVNMHAENFERLIDTGVLEWPVEVTPIDERYCAVTDPRVPEAWKMDHVCTICSPADVHGRTWMYLRDTMKGRNEDER